MFKRAVIVLNGDYPSGWSFRKSDYIICADGGANSLHRHNVVPRVIIGDMDSIEPQVLAYYQPQPDTIIVCHQPDKDQTDGELAVSFLIDSDFFGEVVVIGATGGRFDQTYCNVMLLGCLDTTRFPNARIHTDTEEIYLTGYRFCHRLPLDSTISLLPIDKSVIVIATSGLLYQLTNSQLYRHCGRGVSNVVTAAEVVIEVTGGQLMIACGRTQNYP